MVRLLAPSTSNTAETGHVVQFDMSIILNILTLCTVPWDFDDWRFSDPPAAFWFVFCLVKDLKSRSAPWLAPPWEEKVAYHKGYGANSSPGSVHWGNRTPAIGINVVSFHITEASVVIQTSYCVNGANQRGKRDSSPKKTIGSIPQCKSLQKRE